MSAFAPPAADSATFVWSDAFLLGYPPMDATHKEFVDLVNAMLGCAPGEMLGHLRAFERHAVDHFEQERGWMVDTGFPAAECHIDEHAAVLKSVREVVALLEAGGDAETAVRLAQELARWFPGHADYLDAALSHWMSKRAHGGTPVVLRRGLNLGRAGAAD